MVRHSARQEVVSQLRGGRDAQQPGAGHAGLIHLVRRQLQVRPFRHRQPVLPGPVIHQRGPLGDDVFQLADKQERGVLHVLAAAVDVRALVGGQVLDQPFAQGLEKPLASGLIRRFFRLGRLDGDAQPGAHADHVRRQERLAVIDHQGLRRAHRHPGQPPGLGEHQLLRHPVIGPARLLRPVCRRGPRHDRLEQDARHVHRLGRYRGDPQPGDAAGEQVLDHRQLGAHPPAGDRFHREHVQILGIQDRVLTRPHRPQPPVGPLGPVRDRPAARRAAGHRVGAPGQLGQPPVSGRGRRPGHRVRAVQLIKPRLCFPQHRRPGRRRVADHLGQHQPHRLIPAGIHRRAPAAQRPAGQARLTGFAVGRHPPLHRPAGDPEFFCLGLVTGLQRLPRPVSRTRLAGTGLVRMTGPISGQDLPHVPGLFRDLVQLLTGQTAEHEPR